jgi:NADH:ubiquinone oxidoreductase subunit E
MDKFDTLDTFIGQLAAAADATELLQYLCEIQYRYSCIPPRAIELLAARLKLPPTLITGVIDYYSFLHTTPRGEYDVLFSDSITDHMLGSRELLQQLCERLGVGKGIPRGDGLVTIDTTSCTGICDQGPALLVNGWTVAGLDTVRIDTIADLIEASTPVADIFRATTRKADGGELSVVFGCGGDRDRGKRPQMGALAERLADRVYVTDDNPRSESSAVIIGEILDGMQRPEWALVVADRARAIRQAIASAGPGDLVLVAGKGHEDYQLVGERTLHFDDREQVAQALAERQGGAA